LVCLKIPLDNSMTSYMVSKKTIEINPKHSIMSELSDVAGAEIKKNRNFKLGGMKNLKKPATPQLQSMPRIP